LPPLDRPAPQPHVEFAHRHQKIRPIRSIREYRCDTTERSAMNMRHYAQITNWLRKRPATAIGLAAIVLVASRAIWHWSRAVSRPAVVSVNYADSPTWERQPPAWPNCLPRVTGGSRPAANVSEVATPLPSVEYCPSSTDAPIPTVEAGPELFAFPKKPAEVSIAMPVITPKATTDQVVGRAAITMRLPSTAATVTAPASPAAPAPPRSEAMEMIARQADEKVREGLDLADRGASFAARADFIAALRLVALGLDNDGAATQHSQSLSAALTAMKEAQDFLPSSGKTEGDLDLPTIVAGHVTPLLKKVPAEQLQAMRALKQYFNFAQEQLQLSVGHELAGSMALGALGKLHAAMAEKGSSEMLLPEAKAITFYQAAMLVSPQNYIAANDLGVLRAHKNDFAAARAALEHSVKVCSTSENLKNLSVVYRQLGEAQLADTVARDAESAKAAALARQRSGSLSAGGAVQWVGPDAMTQPTAPWSDVPVRPAAAETVTQAPATANSAAGQPAIPASHALR
jgi:hypothetical protein